MRFMVPNDMLSGLRTPRGGGGGGGLKWVGGSEQKKGFWMGWSVVRAPHSRMLPLSAQCLLDQVHRPPQVRWAGGSRVGLEWVQGPPQIRPPPSVKHTGDRFFLHGQRKHLSTKKASGVVQLRSKSVRVGPCDPPAQICHVLLPPRSAFWRGSSPEN